MAKLIVTETCIYRFPSRATMRLEADPDTTLTVKKAIAQKVIGAGKGYDPESEEQAVDADAESGPAGQLDGRDSDADSPDEGTPADRDISGARADDEPGSADGGE